MELTVAADGEIEISPTGCIKSPAGEKAWTHCIEHYRRTRSATTGEGKDG